jgi:hypothetical protein
VEYGHVGSAPKEDDQNRPEHGCLAPVQPRRETPTQKERFQKRAKALHKKSGASLEQKQETIRTWRVIEAALFRPSRDFVFLD